MIEAVRLFIVVWTKIDKIRAKQAAKPKHSPLPEHAPVMAPISDEMVECALHAYEGALLKLHSNNFDGAEPISVSEIRSAALRAALAAALEGSVAVPVEMTDSDLNLILGRSVICSPTPMTAMFRDFYAAMVKHYESALPRQDRLPATSGEAS